MKVIKLTAINVNDGNKEVTIHLVVGTGLFFTWGEENKASILETIKGTILVKETPDEIRALIANKGE
jgi:hypothetical protein